VAGLRGPVLTVNLIEDFFGAVPDGGTTTWVVARATSSRRLDLRLAATRRGIYTAPPSPCSCRCMCVVVLDSNGDACGRSVDSPVISGTDHE